MPDTLNPVLTEAERKTTADRLWKIMAAIDRRESYSAIKGMVELTVRAIEPFGGEYPKDRPVNAEYPNGGL